MKKVARLISTLLHPMLVIPALDVLIFGVHDIWAGLIVFIGVIAIPFSLHFFLYKTGRLSDFDMMESKERQPIYVATLLGTLIPLFYLYFSGKTELFMELAGLFALGLMMAAVNFKWKVSLHTAISTLLAWVLFLHYGVSPFIFLLVPVMALARIQLKRHTWGEVFWGALLPSLIYATVASGIFLNFQDELRGAVGALPEAEKYQASEAFTTMVDVEGIGELAVRLTLPEEPRYDSGAPIVVNISTFFTDPGGFDTKFLEITEHGLVHASYLWPGDCDRESSICSDGEYDHGGEESIRALAEALKFFTEERPNVEGLYLSDLVEMPLHTDNVGLYAFSHPGIAATNVMARYGEELPNITYMVGRENPTNDILNSVELGHFEGKKAVNNPFYEYPDSYTSTELKVDYSSVRFDFKLGRPYFDLNGNRKSDSADYILGEKIPSMFGKKIYSRELTWALLENGALTRANWPADLTTPEEVDELWPSRISVDSFDDLEGLDFKVMLVFADKDHVQPMDDKPNVHQAYDGFTQAGLWVRLNPDSSYSETLSKEPVLPDNPANAEPRDWLEIDEWSYRNTPGSAQIFSIASVLEMTDRTHYDNWEEDLSEILD